MHIMKQWMDTFEDVARPVDATLEQRDAADAREKTTMQDVRENRAGPIFDTNMVRKLPLAVDDAIGLPPPLTASTAPREMFEQIFPMSTLALVANTLVTSVVDDATAAPEAASRHQQPTPGTQDALRERVMRLQPEHRGTEWRRGEFRFAERVCATSRSGSSVARLLEVAARGLCQIKRPKCDRA